MGELNRDSIDKDIVVKDDTVVIIKKITIRRRNGRDNRKEVKRS